MRAHERRGVYVLAIKAEKNRKKNKKKTKKGGESETNKDDTSICN
jgi:hypothetical protein